MNRWGVAKEPFLDVQNLAQPFRWRKWLFLTWKRLCASWLYRILTG